MNYLFLFTISPVQTFISQARKTQDLYAGSTILSELCRVGINKVERQYQAEIIFPNKNNGSLPNRFIAIMSEQEIDFKTIGEKVELKVKAKFKEIAKKALISSGKKKPNGFDEQIENHLDIHWAFYPFDNNYATSYCELERLLGAIKNVRTFKQLNDGKGEVGRKCSLDGERNALFYRCREVNGKTDKPPPYLQDNAVEIITSKLRPNEGLSAVSFIKRYYNKKVKFASTADIALMQYLENIRSTDTGKNLISYFENKFNKNDLDGQLYYEENLTEKYFDKNGLSEHKNSIKEIKKKLELVDNELKIKKLTVKKTSYYAMIIFDGDNMGKWLSGKLLPKNTDLQNFHIKLSTKLGEFAKDAIHFLDEPYGKSVYAGGDDFLGFVNLNYIFQVMKELRQLFENKVNQPLKAEFQYEKNLTFSAGILIAHYKTPLHIVLLKTRGLEKVAKNHDVHKDAFAIAVMKHSGESHEACYQWQDIVTREWNIDRISSLVKQLQENFSDTFIRSLNHELRLLIDENGQIKNEKLVKTEIKRLIKRSLQDGKPKNLADELCNKLNELFISSNHKVNNFLETLNIANFIRKETNSPT
jgi:CRISPR-associated protein Cmr2